MDDQFGAQPGHDDVVEAFLDVSRALVGVAVRSLDAADGEITLPQHRALVLLASHRAQKVSELADLMGVNSSTATRHCNRLQRRGLVRRERASDDRRAVSVIITESGLDTVAKVSAERRRTIAGLLAAMPPGDTRPLIAALRAFADAAGESPEQSWSLGWTPAGRTR